MRIMKCLVCKTTCKITEHGYDIDGCHEREEAICPICSETLCSEVISGYFSVDVVDEDKRPNN